MVTKEFQEGYDAFPHEDKNINGAPFLFTPMGLPSPYRTTSDVLHKEWMRGYKAAAAEDEESFLKGDLSNKLPAGRSEES